MTVVIDELEVRAPNQPRQPQPEQPPLPPSPSEATAPHTLQEADRQLRHLATRLARLRAH
jgi:hypothetical protein